MGLKKVKPRTHLVNNYDVLVLINNINYLITESEVVMGKSQTDALRYYTARPRFEIFPYSSLDNGVMITLKRRLLSFVVAVIIMLEQISFNTTFFIRKKNNSSLTPNLHNL